LTQQIRITCDTKHMLEPDKLTPLQGDLKALTDKKYEKLKASLLRFGFAFPEFVWKDKTKNYIVDGHQRIRALVKMSGDGIKLEGGKVPIVYVKAKNKKEALALILAATSQYGDLDEDSVFQFVKENALEWADLKAFAEFPALNMGTLQAGWFGDAEIVEDPDAEWKDMPEYQHEDLSSKKRLLVHFATEEDYAAFSKLIGQKLTMDTRSIWFPEAIRNKTKEKIYK